MKLMRRDTKRGRVEIIPMIDTILILLIFYMSFSQFKLEEKQMNAKLPGGPGQGASIDHLTLHVYDRDNITVNGGTAFRAEDLAVYMSQLSLKPTVSIEAELQTHYGDVVAALDACALAHLRKVGIATVPQ